MAAVDNKFAKLAATETRPLQAVPVEAVAVEIDNGGQEGTQERQFGRPDSAPVVMDLGDLGTGFTHVNEDDWLPPEQTQDMGSAPAVVVVPPPPKGGMLLRRGVVAVVVLACGGGLFAYFAPEKFEELTGVDPLVMLQNLPTAQELNPMNLAVESLANIPIPATNLDDAEIDNPYWRLPTELAPGGDVHRSPWQVGDEERWKAALQHEYPYQHFNAVREIRARSMSGSEALLYEGLTDEKFWTRMLAAMGLADFGVKLDDSLVKQAIGDARADLMAHFFKRYRSRASAGEVYVMRVAIRFVPAVVRRQILENLSRIADQYRSLYFAAASLDRSAIVRDYMATHMLFSNDDLKKLPALPARTSGPVVAHADTSKSAAQPSSAPAPQRRTDDNIVEEVKFFAAPSASPVPKLDVRNFFDLKAKAKETPPSLQSAPAVR